MYIYIYIDKHNHLPIDLSLSLSLTIYIYIYIYIYPSAPEPRARLTTAPPASARGCPWRASTPRTYNGIYGTSIKTLLVLTLSGSR